MSATTAGASKILRGAPYLPVPDVSALGAHYRDVLGFSLEYAGGSPPEFAIYSRDGCAVMLRRVAPAAKIVPNEAQGGTWDVFFWVQGVDALHEELVAKGASIAYAPVVQPYGMKEFAVRDPLGYVLGFGESWPPGAAS